MTTDNPTRIGCVRRVTGNQLIVALDRSLAGAVPIFNGDLYPVGQIGSIVRIPQGVLDLVGQVSNLSISGLQRADGQFQTPATDERLLQVELLGEILWGTSEFRRGVGIYPGLDDPVHFATADDLRLIFPPADGAKVQIGNVSAAKQVPVCIDLQRLVTRHSVVLGATGSGKTSAVSSLLQRVVRNGWDSANIIVIDPHGEYASALGAEASVRSVLDDGPSALQVPFWALPAGELLAAVADGPVGQTTIDRFEELVADARRVYAGASNWLQIDPDAVTPDTPTPFDIREVWYRLDYDNNETIAVAGDPDSACVKNPGEAQRLIPASFKHYGPASAPPFKGPYHGVHREAPKRLRMALQDPRLKFLTGSAHVSDDVDPMPTVIANWLGNEDPISVLDFSGVPTRAGDLAIGLVLQLLFEISVQSSQLSEGIGHRRPVLIVLEEAHRYLNGSASKIATETVNRIAREGRKYGVGLMLVSQRPSELPATAVSQCGSVIALRMTSSADQAVVRALLPDSVTGLADSLSSLRTGEALVSGEALALPVRTTLSPPRPSPQSDDPTLESWRMPANGYDLEPPIARWRGIRL